MEKFRVDDIDKATLSTLYEIDKKYDFGVFASFGIVDGEGWNAIMANNILSWLDDHSSFEEISDWLNLASKTSDYDFFLGEYAILDSAGIAEDDCIASKIREMIIEYLSQNNMLDTLTGIEWSDIFPGMPVIISTNARYLDHVTEKYRGETAVVVAKRELEYTTGFFDVVLRLSDGRAFNFSHLDLCYDDIDLTDKELIF